MSRIYELSDHSSTVIEWLKAGQIAGLKHHANTDKESLWPDGVTDGKHFAWFESNMLLAWGMNDEAGIVRKLRKAGFSVRYIG